MAITQDSNRFEDETKQTKVTARGLRDFLQVYESKDRIKNVNKR